MERIWAGVKRRDLLRLHPGRLALALAGPILAASPAPTDAVGGDPRSAGQGPGLVGDPLVAVFAVLAIGLGAVALTLLYVKLTGGRRT